MHEAGIQIHVAGGPPSLTLAEIQRQACTYLEKTAVLRAILFGSFARGDADFASDVDLVLIEHTSVPFVERGRRHLPLFRMGVGVDMLVYTPEEYDRLSSTGNPLIERVEHEGITIYERSKS